MQEQGVRNDDPEFLKVHNLLAAVQRQQAYQKQRQHQHLMAQRQQALRQQAQQQHQQHPQQQQASTSGQQPNGVASADNGTNGIALVLWLQLSLDGPLLTLTLDY